MNSVWIALFAFVGYIVAYRTYGRYIAHKIFKLNPDNTVPSKELRDDIDYVPTKKGILFGHHFASIAGTGPIVGPAIAIIWGWVPALIWVFLGAIFMGGVHDLSALIISVRHKGVTIGELSETLVNGRVRTLLLLVMFFGLWIVIAIFGLVIAIIFKLYPQSVFPVWMEIPIALTLGWLIYRKGANATLLSIGAIILMYITIIIGVYIPLEMPALRITATHELSPVTIWVLILLAYAFIASVLPVWRLLQPRDYINAHELIVGLGLLVLGVIFAHPVMVAPRVNFSPAGAPFLFPMIFVTIACGAISGFHSLVGSGTSSKQLYSEKDAMFIGYGGMIMEGILAVLVIIAVGAGIGLGVKNAAGELVTGVAAWNVRYESWTAAFPPKCPHSWTARRIC